MSNSTENIKISSKIDSKYRKIYRSLVEKSKKLDEIYKSENAFLRVFQSETTLLREKLKSYCETLIFREPIEFAKKAEEILWRKAFYEIINIIKLNKKNLKFNAEIETMYRMHLSSAYGFYNHLLLRFQSEFNSVIRLEGFLNLSLVGFEKQAVTHSQEKSDLLKEVAVRILHKFLICLGDLVRYQTEYDPRGCTVLAYKYYHMSLNLLPSNGMPLNQLGTLYGSENYGCDAAYYYLYCLSCSEPFVSARENLKLVFSKNRRRYEEINNPSFLTETSRLDQLRLKEIKRFLVNFLGIMDYVLCNSALLNPRHQQTYEKIDLQRLQEMCQLCLQQFNSCMFYTANNVSDNMGSFGLAYLSDELVFKLTLIILMTIEQLKPKKNTNINHTKAQLNVNFTFIAFALVFFSHLVNHAIIRFEQSIMSSYTRRILEKVNINEFEEELNNEINIEKKGSIEQQKNTRPKIKKDFRDENKKNYKTQKKNLRLIYCHRRRKHNSDSDTNDEDESSGSMYEDESKVFNEYQNQDEATSDDDSEPRAISQRPKRRLNVAKFLERENLSETEMNEAELSNSSTDTSTESGSDSGDDLASSLSTDSDQKLTGNHKNKEKPNEVKKDSVKPTTSQSHQIAGEEFPTYSGQAEAVLKNSINNNFNFKELSVQLLSNFSSLNNDATVFASSINTVSDEFIDNEIYKFVLNGGNNLSNLQEMNPKEALENEELGKKIATFQIETDSEASDFCSDNDNSDKQPQASTTTSGHDQKETNIKWRTKSSKLDLQNAQQIIDAFESQNLLPTIKVFCDWLLCNKKIIQSISNVPTSMWSKLAILLNLIPLEKQIAKICTNEKIRSVIIKSSETKSWNYYPLSEDIKLRSFNGLKLEHISLKFDINKQNELDFLDEHLLRLCSLRRFGYLIASLSQSQSNSGGNKFFEYDNRRALFVAHEQTTNLNENNLSCTANRDVSTLNPSSVVKSVSSGFENKVFKDDRKLQLMKSMAQLRLEAEISQLESSYKNDEAQQTPYLVPDTFVLCNCLRMIQDVIKSNKSLIIIPLAVIDTLDSMKKDSKQAREAIRWLESQFKQGNRFMRVQNQNEKLIEDKISKKKENDLHIFQQIIDCCLYFQQHHKIEGRKSVVSMIYDGNEGYLESERFTNLVKTLKENGIDLVTIQDLWNRIK